MGVAVILSGMAFALAPREEVDRSHDICAIYALPERPGEDHGDSAGMLRAGGLETTGWIAVEPGDVAGEVSCQNFSGIQRLHFSPDGIHAESYGGWQAGPLNGAWGNCLYEKTEGRWRTLACFVTAVS